LDPPPQYLGGEKERKRVVKASEKFRFKFDWDAQEDTSRDLNPLYNNLHGEGGGGRVAGACSLRVCCLRRACSSAGRPPRRRRR
jgi:hypothetical protein